VAHQAKHCQQLRLGELMFAEARALGWQNPRGYLQGHASKGQESNLGHRPSCFIRKHRKPLIVDLSKLELCQGCQQCHFKSFVLEVRILKELETCFAEVRNLKELRFGREEERKRERPGASKTRKNLPAYSENTPGSIAFNY
jgi:hypothetical protein